MLIKLCLISNLGLLKRKLLDLIKEGTIKFVFFYYSFIIVS